ncbi:hypothetical protein A2U01_0112413, partial [Trifolium medium]|nr:hypothetical protein [Trifolium medium]
MASCVVHHAGKKKE